jgi:hypothetical protein
MDCSICCEKYNVSNHKKVPCPFCDFNSCRTCVQTYLLSVSTDPHCMGCKKLWSREVVDGACTKVFRDTKLKKHRETILFEREKCLMPQSQDAASRVLQGRRIDKLMKDAEDEIIRIKQSINDLYRTKISILNGANQTYGATTEKRVFVRRCPVDDCRGFLSTRWKCQICDNNICSECNEVKKGDDHTCDPNNVETVKLLKKDTKPCPSCGTMIFKISGCSQMWCPDCHTAFDWNTMKIETGRIHNPHYYEFQRNGGGQANRENGDIPCGGVPSVIEILDFLGVPRQRSRYYVPNTVDNPVHNEILKIHRIVLHIQNAELPRMRAPAVDNQPMRVMYLLNELSEEAMKVALQKNEKAREKLRDRVNIIQMFCDVTGDLLRQLLVKVVTIEQFLENSNRLRDYVREAFTTLHKRYSCSTDWISDGWDFVRNNYQKPIVVE